MALARPLLLCGALALAGCSGLANSVVNPMTWFGKSTSRAVDPERAANPLIPALGITNRRKEVYAGQPVDQISDLRIERRPGGAIVHVVGLAEVIGYYDVRLEPENEGRPVDGVLSYTLKAVPPPQAKGSASASARSINAAKYLTDQELDGVRTITVRGARNQRTTRRR